MRLFDFIVVGGLFTLAAVVLLSIPFPQLDILFGSIFHSWQNTLAFCIGMFFLVLGVAIFGRK